MVNARYGEPLNTASAAICEVRLVSEVVKVPARVWHEMFTELLEYDDTPQLPRISAPTLLIWGANDGLVPFKFGEAYQRLITHAKLVVISEAGHAPFEEQPDAFLGAFETFLRAESVG